MPEKSRRLFCVLMENPHDPIGNPACYACYPTREWAEKGMEEASRVWPNRAMYIQAPIDGPVKAQERLI